MSSEPDGVSLSWFVLEATLWSPSGDLITPKGIIIFTLERQPLSTGKWMLVTSVPASERAYLDRNVDFGARYRYRITATLGAARK